MRNAEGSVAVQSAMLILLVLGFIALGVEMSQLLLEHRKQQSVADSAAMAAASAVKLGVSDLQGEARAVTAQLGYRNGVDGVAVTAANPPASGPHLGDANYVEVKVGRTFTPALTQLFRRGPFTVQARSVASIGAGGATVCALVLDPSSSDAVSLSNRGTIRLPNCGITVNSTSNSAVRMSNNTTIEGDLDVAGDIVTTNSADVTGTVSKGASPGDDPYAGIILPTPGPLRTANLSNNEKATLRPGVYESGWNFWGNQEITLEPGVYYIQSQLSISNNVKVTGSNVTLVVDGPSAISMSNHTALNLTAPTTGPTAGVAIYSARSTSQQSFSNNVTLNVTGALYFPNQTVELSNHVSTGASACTQLIARKLVLSNNVDLVLNGSCAGTGISQLGAASRSSLVE